MHTPGPWSRSGNVIVGPHGETIVTAHRNVSFDMEASDLAEGNARLIEAATDFFEAAETMAHAEDSGGDAWWRGFEALKAALKKAGGRFPSMDAVRQPDICPGDNKHCKTEGDEAHFRCGTVQCGQKSLHQF